MKDKFQRNIDYIRISVTDRCNLRCLYCMPDGTDLKTHDEIMRDEEIIETVKSGVKLGITKVRITGGEPLVRRGVYELIKKISDVKEVKEITITTNGLLLIGNVKKLKEAGVTRVNFSLDTIDKEKFKYITNTVQTLDYLALIKELIAEKMTPVKINTVLIKGVNDTEIDAFIDLADKYDIMIRLIELMPIGHLSFNHDDHFISREEILKANPRLKFLKDENTASYYHVEGKRGLIGFINPISHKFCESCNRIRLTSDGHLLPCLHSKEELNVKNINKEELVEKLREAITLKPKEHRLNDSNEEEDFEIDRSMNRIGG